VADLTNGSQDKGENKGSVVPLPKYQTMKPQGSMEVKLNAF
jgi:hypothetical protein